MSVYGSTQAREELLETLTRLGSAGDAGGGESKGNMFTGVSTRSMIPQEQIYPFTLMNKIITKIRTRKTISYDDAIFILGGIKSSTWLRTPGNCFSYYPAPKDQLGTVTKYEEELLASSNERHMDLIRFMAEDSIKIHHDDRGEVPIDLKFRYLAGPNSYSRDKLNSFMDTLPCHPRYDWTMGCFVFSDRIQSPGGGADQRKNSFYNIPIWKGDGTVFSWRPTYEGMSEDDLKSLMNGLVRQEGTMFMNWSWAEEASLTPKVKALLNTFKTHFDNEKWTRTLSGHEIIRDGPRSRRTATPFSEFSNLNLSDRYGRIYQMICFFNLDSYWESDDNFHSIVRINYGFLIYHIMLTILGEFAESENNSNAHNYWSVKQSDINKLFSYNILDLTFLPEQIMSGKAKVPPTPSQITNNIGKYNQIMIELNKHFQGVPRRIQVYRLYQGSSAKNRKLLLCNISHGTLFTKSFGLELINHMMRTPAAARDPLESSDGEEVLNFGEINIVDDGNRSLCLCDEREQLGVSGLNDFTFINVALNCTPNIIPIKTPEFTTRKNVIHQINYAASPIGIFDNYITENIIQTELRKAFDYLKKIGISISVMPRSNPLQSRYGPDVWLQVHRALGDTASTRRFNTAGTHNVVDFLTGLHTSDRLKRWIEDWEAEPDRAKKDRIWSEIIKKLRKRGLSQAANYLESKTGTLRNAKLNDVLLMYPFLIGGKRKTRKKKKKRKRKKKKTRRKRKKPKKKTRKKHKTKRKR